VRPVDLENIHQFLEATDLLGDSVDKLGRVSVRDEMIHGLNAGHREIPLLGLKSVGYDYEILSIADE
jgi:hypothetical protein